MKVLIVAKNIGKGAAGIIYRRFIEEFFRHSYLKFELLTNFYQSNFIKELQVHVIPNQLELDERINKLSVMLLKQNLNGINWVLKSKNYAKVYLKGDYDWVISFVNGGAESTAHVGAFIAALNQSKHYIHMVDPIPPTRGWETYELYRKNLIFGIKKPLQTCTIFSLSNDIMSEYQAKLLGLTNYFTVHNPVQSDELIKVKRNEDGNTYNYVFLGTMVTGPRNPYKLFKAFENLVIKYPNSRLLLYGNDKRLDRSFIPGSIVDKVFIQEFTSDVISVIQDADCFIDIDADLPEDVFISSKLQMYLSYNRPILSITGQNSPTRRLLKEMRVSCLISSFDVNEIEESLLAIRELKVNESFLSERNFFLKNNTTSAQVKRIISKLKLY
ncbi:MAG: hypothetical protein ACXIUD_11080 [Mongoliitalea sp.]